MSKIRETLDHLSQATSTYAHALDEAGYSNYKFLPDDSPYDLSFMSPEALEARGNMIAAAEQILRLAKGPQGCLASYADMVCLPYPFLTLCPKFERVHDIDCEKGIELGTIQALTQLGVPDKVPLQGSVDYEDLAAMVSVSPELLQRLVRLAALAGFFVEDESGAIRHSAMSAVFLRDPGMGDTTRLMFDVDVRAYSRFGDSIRLDPTGLKIRDGPTALAFQSGADGQGNRPTIWEIMERDPIQQTRFHSMMQTLGGFPSHLLKHVLSAFDWNRIGTLVDVGGSLGHVSLVIAEAFLAIRITVQDLQEVVEKGRLSLPAVPSAERITFQTHDFFHVQEAVADAYLLRQILHDWPDEDAARIVKNLVPALRPGARILVMDIIVPEPGMLSPYMEKYLRTYDVSMFSMFSGKERTLSQLRDIVERCDGRLQFEGMTCPPGSAATLLSWVFLAN